MFKFLLVASLAIAAHAVSVVYVPGYYPSASVYQAKDSIGNYAFSHHTGHHGGPSYHSESGDASGKKVGSYGVRDADGKVRIVNYVADQGGFRADIKTSEDVDKDAKTPAGVTISKAEPLVYAHPFGYYYAPL